MSIFGFKMIVKSGLDYFILKLNKLLWMCRPIQPFWQICLHWAAVTHKRLVQSKNKLTRPFLSQKLSFQKLMEWGLAGGLHYTSHFPAQFILLPRVLSQKLSFQKLMEWDLAGGLHYTSHFPAQFILLPRFLWKFDHMHGFYSLIKVQIIMFCILLLLFNG